MNPTTNTEAGAVADVAAIGKRELASLTKLERQWLKGRMCGFCEANMLGNSCYAHSGEWTLSPLKGVRDKEEVIDLGPPCDMDERRAQALQFYKPRAVRQHLEQGATAGVAEMNEQMFGQGDR